MAFQRGETWWGRCPRRDRPAKRVSLGTRDRSTATKIERTLRQLEDERRWPILEAICDPDSSVSAGDVFDAQRDRSLDELEARLTDLDVTTLLPDFSKWIETRVAPSTASKYLRQLDLLWDDQRGLMRSEIDRTLVSRRLRALIARGVSGSTARRYLAAWSQFFTFLRDEGVLDRNPARDVSAPRGNPPRERWLPLESSLRLVNSTPPPYRALFALLEGCGAEIGAALRTRRKDVDLSRRIVRVHGTKGPARDRFALVDSEFWPEIESHCRLLTPETPLWDGVTDDMARHRHRKACHALEIEDYRVDSSGRRNRDLHDASRRR